MVLMGDFILMALVPAILVAWPLSKVVEAFQDHNENIRKQGRF